LSDISTVTLLATGPNVLLVNPDVPAKNLTELIAYIKANPGKVEYGSGGSGLTVHITMELMKKQAGVEMLHVPYKGAAPMITDLIAGRVQFAFEVGTAIMPFVEGGQVKVLGVASLKRSAAAPDVPTLDEQGLTGFESTTWGVLLAPKGTPKDIIAFLNDAANKAIKTKEALDFFAKNGSEPKGGTPEECGAYMKQEREKWAPVILASGAQVD
jgi:tripartite-type tricarboxylate transporter receptor subunit TctC